MRTIVKVALAPMSSATIRCGVRTSSIGAPSSATMMAARRPLADAKPLGVAAQDTIPVVRLLHTRGDERHALLRGAMLNEAGTTIS